VLLVLALLYAAMNSGRTVLAILLTVPFAQSGGAFALLIADVPLSVSAAIGFITLLGQVSLMGLLLLGATEARRLAGEALDSALVEGCVERLRPVLMASILAMFGLLPMAVATSVGSETQRPFALVVVGGMATTLLVSLFVLYQLGNPQNVEYASDWMPAWLVDLVSGLSPHKYFVSIARGVLDSRDIVYFACFCGFFLYANALVLESRRQRG
jgi:Cu/Ag efflux pump CusA